MFCEVSVGVCVVSKCVVWKWFVDHCARFVEGESLMV